MTPAATVQSDNQGISVNVPLDAKETRGTPRGDSAAGICIG